MTIETARPPAVECRDLTHRYGNNTVVNGLNLTIGRGEVFGLLGPNGAGKSTTIRLVNTLVPVQHGTIRVLGFDVGSAAAMDVRYNIGYVPQQLSIEAGLTGRQNVTWFARLFDVPRRERTERVNAALDALHLLDVADQMAGSYSGGMIRRLELAQALVNRPALLILDEPTVGLDPIARDSVWERVADMRNRFGMTVLLTTHYMEEADALCDRVAMLHKGVLQTVGSPAELKRELGPTATLEDVFRHYAGAALDDTTEEGCAMSDLLADPPSEWVDPGFAPVRAPRGWSRVPALASRVGTFALVEIQKLRHDQTEVLTRAVQPVLWMLIFGTTFSRLHSIPTGKVPYLDFLAPGIIAQSALFISIFYGIQIIWDRDAGILNKLMVTPTPRSALIAGKCFAAGVRAIAQIFVIVVVSLLMGVGMTVNPLRILAAVPVVFLGAAFFACLSMTIAGLVQARDRLMGIGQAITMPLFFASNALYPVDLMPTWLKVISHVNPLSYEVDALRGLLIGTPATLWLDFVVLIGAAVLGVGAAATLLGRLVR